MGLCPTAAPTVNTCNQASSPDPAALKLDAKHTAQSNTFDSPPFMGHTTEVTGKLESPQPHGKQNAAPTHLLLLNDEPKIHTSP
ncbi:hypothetical protein E4T56_gene3124 [Termitomyces sp. T112]|nr:hypothetical protein E4T56_gene3124 [Termitomyces sp. T112]